MPSQILGVFFHWLGGLASASFYIPYLGVRKWSWETYWLVGGVFSWIIAPMVLASLLVPDLFGVLKAAWETSPNAVKWAYLFGAMWGLGGLTFGLTMRYLGIALGMAVALGYCAAFGTLMPPIFDGTFGEIAGKPAGQIILLGVAICLAGIAVTGMAGMSKEGELSEEEKKAAVPEFSFFKGILVATFSGIMSAGMSYGFTAGEPIAKLAESALLASQSQILWRNLPVLVVVLWGGFTTNFLWCLILNIKNRSGHEYLALSRTVVAEVSAAEGIAQFDAEDLADRSGQSPPRSERVPIGLNYLLSATAGTVWYMQFFFYSMGKTQMGAYDFSSWTLHMASIIIFSSLWGIALREWKGTSSRTRIRLAIGLILLIGSTIVVGWGNYLNAPPPAGP